MHLRNLSVIVVRVVLFTNTDVPVTEAQIRFLKAKLRVMQEELTRVTRESYLKVCLILYVISTAFLITQSTKLIVELSIIKPEILLTESELFEKALICGHYLRQFKLE